MKTLLIANRGEIACRIIRTARRCGIRTVAVYSDADAHALHVSEADEAFCIGTADAADSYLHIPRVIDAARRSGADAIHPGYGFLSENPAFVDACDAEGIVFVGPTAEAMRAMGLKDAAKRLMEDAGVPVVPGYHGESQEPGVLAAEADKIGYPVLIKARAGGGGKGMRQVSCAADFPAALQAAQRESLASFADAHVLIEKLIAVPRHIEIQVFGDSHGQLVHLYERDCSLQRRHQKVIEEAPAPGMTEVVREAMTRAAIAAAKAIDYRGAGTVEFIVDASEGLRADRFWFMEMNTRLQVEHPVTEAVTGVDLVEWQLRIADGEPLPMRQVDIPLLGHAVEARLYAEDPASGFLPAVGQLERLRFSDVGRVDSGVVEGDNILPHYDPMLAKLICHGQTRTQAFQRLAQQLADSLVLGTETNREFLWQLVRNQAVLEGRFDTSFIAQHLAELVPDTQKARLLALACLELVDPLSEPCQSSVSRRLGAWQLWGRANYQLRFEMDNSTCLVHLRQRLSSPERYTCWSVSSDQVEGLSGDGIEIGRVTTGRVRIDGQDFRATACRQGQRVLVQLGPYSGSFVEFQPGLSASNDTAGDSLVSPMPGRVVAVQCRTGDTVKAGQSLMIIEAMKMEQELCSQRDGVVEQVLVAVGDQVQQGLVLVKLAE